MAAPPQRPGAAPPRPAPRAPRGAAPPSRAARLPAPPAAARGLLVDQDAKGAMRVRYTDRRSGGQVWSRTLAAQAQLVPVDPAIRAGGGFLATSADGTVTLLARESGAVLSTRQVPRLFP